MVQQVSLEAHPAKAVLCSASLGATPGAGSVPLGEASPSRWSECATAPTGTSSIVGCIMEHESFLNMRAFTSVRSRSERSSDYLFLALLVAALLVSAFFILKDSGRPLPHPMDQSFILFADLQLGRDNGHWVFRYPNLMFSGGVSSSLIVGFYKLLVPVSPENINWHIRIFAMICYLGSSFLLIRQLIGTTALRLLALTIIATSGFQFIQPSSEIFAGSLLTMFLFAVSVRWPFWITSLLLAMFGLAKVEFIIASIALAFFWWLWERRRGNTHAVWALILTIAWLGLMLLPCLFVEGSNLQRFDRSMGSFLPTYVELFMPHQFSPSGLSIDDIVSQLKAGQFREATSFLKFVIQHPDLYANYLGLSAVKGLPYFMHSLKFMLIPMAYVLFFKAQHVRPLLLLLLIAALFTLIPTWMLSYVRIRYLVKLFPVFATLAISGCEELIPSRPWINLVVWASGIGTIFWQLIYFNDIWGRSHFL